MKRRIGYLKQSDGFIDITVPPAMADEFRMLVQRATNTWQDMSPDMRDFADRVLERDHVMGSNMKDGMQVEEPEFRYYDAHLATRSCCGTLLREPHLTSCAELAKVPNNSNIAKLRGVTWNCFWPTGCSDTTRCKAAGQCCAQAQRAEY